MATRSRLFSSAAWHDWVKAQVFTSGAWHEVQRIRAYKTSGSPPTSGWRDVYIKGGTTPTPTPSPTPTPTPPPSVTLSAVPTPSSVSGSRTGIGAVTTNVVTIVASKGTPPYTYTFTRSTYSGTVVPTINAVAGHPEQATFSRNMAGTVPETETARFKCRIVDTLGNSGTCYIDATFSTVSAGIPSGDGIGPCVVETTLELMANDTRDGPGEAKPIGTAKVGEWVWTRPVLPDDSLGDWGAFQIIRQERSYEPVFEVRGLPNATAEHRSWSDEDNEWAHYHRHGKFAGYDWVIKQSVAGALTYFTPGGGNIKPQGVINHNVKPAPTGVS